MIIGPCFMLRKSAVSRLGESLRYHMATIFCLSAHPTNFTDKIKATQ